MIFFSFTSPIFIFVYCLIIFLIIGLIAALIIFREYKNTNTVLIKENKSKKSLTVSKDIQKASSGDPTQVNQNIERFSELLILDEHAEEIKNVTFDNVTSLATFCDDFRNFCAYNKKLYYSIDDIRSFIANLATSKIMILQGMSGTGKTSIALAFEDFIGNQTTVIAVQPMWKERSDMVGYFNEFTKKFNETPLLKELYRSNFTDQIFIIVLDEVNIARIEYYFAEFLSLLEYPNVDQRTIEITNDCWPKDPKLLVEGRLKIRPNVYFLGTANNDESTFSISDKVYDRAMVMNLDNKAKRFESDDQGPVKISHENFENLAKVALKSFNNYESIAEKSNKINRLIISNFGITFGNRMMNQLKNYVPIYVACGGSEEEAFDDFVAKKILRKLESKDALKVSSAIPSFIDGLNAAFGKGKMKKCRKYVERFEVK